MNNLGNRIKKARISKGMTQEELAEKIEVSRVSIAKYESGEMQPRLSNFRMIADALNVSADYLLDIENRKNTEEKKILENLPAESIKVFEDIITEVIGGMRRK